MKKRVWALYIILLGVFVLAPVARGGYLAESTFVSGNDGWTIVDFPTYDWGVDNPPAVVATYTPHWQATGGSPNGYIWFPDPSGYSFFFSAPADYLGNVSAAYGRTLTYCMTIGYGS